MRSVLFSAAALFVGAGTAWASGTGGKEMCHIACDETTKVCVAKGAADYDKFLKESTHKCFATKKEAMAAGFKMEPAGKK